MKPSEPLPSDSPVSGALVGVASGTALAFWDSETNGLLPELKLLHCLGLQDDAGYLSYDDHGISNDPISTGISRLECADVRVAHNGIDFDERAIRKVRTFQPKPTSKVIDTLVLARLLFANVFKTGPNNHKVDPQLRTRHSLKAWGQRLGEKKADYHPPDDDWNNWDPEMVPYMEQDVKTLRRLFTFLVSRKPSWLALENEQRFASIMARQEAWGFNFDVEKARRLAAELQRLQADMEGRLVDHFGEWWAQEKEVRIAKSREVKMVGFPDVTIARFNSKGKPLKPYVGPPKIHYEEGATYTPIERKIFNPGSRDDVKFKLHQLYGWKPTKFNKPTKDKKTGKMKPPSPVIDDEVLRMLPWPEAQTLADYFVVTKTAGALASGNKAWLSLVGADNKMHGRVIHIGTYTHRAAHMDPNLGQVRAVMFNKDKETLWGLEGNYGADCRSLFLATNGFDLVGTDAAGIQLRLFGHYLARFDGGEYARIVAEEDPHAWLRDIVGCDILGEGSPGRDKGKTIGYARLLGGGDLRLGQIAAPLEKPEEQKRIGKLIRTRLAERFKAEALLKEAVNGRVLNNGYILSLDGRRVDVLKAHTGLATLLQAGEKVVMATAIGLLDDRLQKDLGWVCGVDEAGRKRDPSIVDYEFCANVHDEWEADVKPEHTLEFVAESNRSIRVAGEMLNLKIALKGESRVGKSWLDVH